MHGLGSYTLGKCNNVSFDPQSDERDWKRLDPSGSGALLGCLC